MTGWYSLKLHNGIFLDIKNHFYIKLGTSFQGVHSLFIGGIGLEVISIKKMISYGSSGVAEANYYT